MNSSQASSNAPLFLVTVDAEEEWDWAGPLPKAPFSTRNIEALPGFQAFCREHGVVPTYFVDHAVASCEAHVEMLNGYLRHGDCDVGAQLHTWCNPPMSEEATERNSHAVNLSIAATRAKLDALTTQLSDSFGQHPFSFRCGRWGMNAALLQLIGELGYRVDSSVRPFYESEWFNYRGAPRQPYWPDCADIVKPAAHGKVLEIPVTEGYNRIDFDALDSLHTSLSTGWKARLPLIALLWHTRFMRRIALTPEGFGHHDLCRCIDMHMARGARVLNLFFHSSDLLPGSTPYVHTNSDLKRFHMTLSRCFEYARTRYGARFVSVREAHARLTQNRNDHTG